MLGIYAQSLVYVEVPVTNAQNINPTNDVVQFAFLGPYGNAAQATESVPTATTTWYTGAWQSTGTPYTAIILVGPTSTVGTLATGTYLVVIRITDSPEVPVLYSGPMVVS